MLFQSSVVRAALEGITWKLTSDPELQKDLMQEALVVLWIEELRHPGRTESWYIQKCRCHLKDELHKGRSVDSYKRRKGQVPAPVQAGSADSAESFEWEAGFGLDEGTLDQINVRDAEWLLLRNLPRLDRVILLLLIRGFEVEDIARRLGRSRHFVISHRKGIALLAARFGVEPPGAAGRSKYA